MAPGTAVDHWPHNTWYISSSLLCNSPHPILQQKQRHRGIREVYLHYLIYQHDYLVVVAKVPRDSQEIHCKAGSMNAPRTLETPFPCPVQGQTIPVTVLSKCITFWQKGRQLTLFTVFYHVVHLRLLSVFYVFDKFCLFAVEWKGTAFKYKLLLITCCMWSCFL